MTADDSALVDRFLDMMAAEAGASHNTIAAYRNEILQTLDQSQVLVLSGETGW